MFTASIWFSLFLIGGVHLRQLNYRDWRNFQYERPYGNNRGAEEISAEDDPCNGEDYCEDVDDYPHEAAMKAMEMLTPEMRAMFTPRNETQRRSEVMGSDYQFQSQGSYMACDTVKAVVEPLRSKNTKGVWRNILNGRIRDVPGVAQQIHTVKCASNGAHCAKKALRGAGSTVTKCETQYSKTQLLTITRGRTAVIDEFSFPIGCSCVIYKYPVGQH